MSYRTADGQRCDGNGRLEQRPPEAAPPEIADMDRALKVAASHNRHDGRGKPYDCDVWRACPDCTSLAALIVRERHEAAALALKEDKRA